MKKEMTLVRSILAMWKLEELNSHNKIFKEDIIFDYDNENKVLNLYTTKPGALIGVKGAHIENLSKHIKKANIEGISSDLKKININEIKNYV